MSSHGRSALAPRIVLTILTILCLETSAEPSPRHAIVSLTVSSQTGQGTAPDDVESLTGDAASQDFDVRVQSGAVVSGDELRRLPIRETSEITALQAGVVLDRQTGLLYVRGGAVNAMVYIVDGIPLQDPFSSLSEAKIGTASIERIVSATDQASARHAWGTSGVTDISTVDGGRKTHGSAEAITDNFHGGNFDYNLYSLAVNGPLIPNSDRLTYSVAVEREWRGDRQPHAKAGGILPHNSSSLWKWNGKLRWKAARNITARIGAFGSYEDFKEYSRWYHFNMAHAPRTVEKVAAIWGEVEHALSARTNYTLRAYRVAQDRRRGDGVHFDNLWRYGRPNGNAQMGVGDLFWRWDDMYLDPDSLALGVKFPQHTEVVESTYTVHLSNGDSVRQSFVVRGDEGSVWEDYLHEEGSYVGGSADLTNRIGDRYSLSVGAEFQRFTLRYYHHMLPQMVSSGSPHGFRYADFYGFDETDSRNIDEGLNGARHPIRGAGYLRASIALAGARVTAGLHLDYFDYRSLALRDLDPRQHWREFDLSNFERTKTFVLATPRVGVAFQIPGGTQLRFSSGKYHQWPALRAVYMNYDLFWTMKTSTPFLYLLSNPRLKPLETTSHELGIGHQFGGFLTAGITGFYRDMGNQLMGGLEPDWRGDYLIYSNGKNVISKGLEFQIDLERRWGLSGRVRYTIQKAIHSYWTWGGEDSWGGPWRRHSNGLVEYDQRRKLTLIADARLGAGEGPRLGETRPLERAGVNVVFSAANGFPYTPTGVYNSASSSLLLPDPKPYNNERVPALYRLDLKADREFSLGGINLDLYLWVINVFNRANALEVYSGTGKADDNGWLETSEGQSFARQYPSPVDASLMSGEQLYRFRQQDPLHYDTPRQIRAGIVVGF